jgi:uncharacterized secreted protein with C-terminal beta-propeller domain
MEAMRMISTRRRIVGSYLTVAFLLLIFAAPAATYTEGPIPDIADDEMETSTEEDFLEIVTQEHEATQEEINSETTDEEDPTTTTEEPLENEIESDDPVTSSIEHNIMLQLGNKLRSVMVDIVNRKGIGHWAIEKEVVQEEEVLDDSETKYDLNCGKLKNFANKSEIEYYVTEQAQEVRDDLYWFWVMTGNQLVPGIGLAFDQQGGGLDYSGTNIQVAGVDEPDMVKTDGYFLYVLTGEHVVILRAYPASQAQVISRIDVGEDASEILVKDNRLVVFQRQRPDEHVKIYNIADRAYPKLIQDVSFERSRYIDARMIDDHVYVVISRYVQIDPNDGLILPKITNNGAATEVQPTQICHFDDPAPYYEFILVVSIDLVDREVRYKSFMADSTSDMYVSRSNIYIAGVDYGGLHVWDWWSFFWIESTNLHKISIDDGFINYVASGNVTGWVLNQFSMDEYEGYFRVATTSGGAWAGSGSQNNLYVLGSTMETVGSLENLATGETIHSARFMANRCYLVTFKKIDPFFVIDLSDPTSPTVLGELKIPGYSDYLHPYDANHIIGLGKDAYDMGDFAWFQGVKLSMFDVTDVANPKEISTYIIGDRGTESEALYDHKAFMFDKEKNLLIIPIDLRVIDESEYPDGAPPSTYGDFVWQGAYIFKVTPEGGFVLKGTVSHSDHLPDFESNYHQYRPYYVRRSLYIEQNLYTISLETVKINLIDNLAEIKTIDI